ncbi:hypothetical protein CYANOKiyG1_53170 [Okeania sp. KiyG1]|nr:hypothetical protein CYANOKiyG1_53170 [Okeania sp. KiyG1]
MGVGEWGEVNIRIINIKLAEISMQSNFACTDQLTTEVLPKYSNTFGNWYKRNLTEFTVS